MTTDLQSTAMPTLLPHERGSAARLAIIWLLRSNRDGMTEAEIARALPTRRDEVPAAVDALHDDDMLERHGRGMHAIYRIPPRILRQGVA